MAFEAFMSIKAAKQGQFKGEVAGVKGREQWMRVLSFSMDVKSPIDIATRQGSGKRQWQPLAILKEWGAASPQALAACATNETLTEVTIEFSQTSTTGPEVVHQVVKLTDAHIVEVDRHTAGGDGSGGTATAGSPLVSQELERWSFTFNKIEVTDVQAKTSFQDNWELRV